MTLAAAQKFAWHKTIRATTIMLIILIALMIIGDSHYFYDSVKNFFLRIFSNVYVPIVLIVLYLLTWFFSGIAVKEIIFGKKNFAAIALKYALLISLQMCLPVLIIAIITQSIFSIEGIEHLIVDNFSQLFLGSAFCLFFPWLWATNRMKSLQPSPEEGF